MGETFESPGDTPLDSPADYCPDGAGRWLRLAEGRDAGKRLFYWDAVFDDGTTPTGAYDGDPAATVVFVHGNPECSYTWRNVVDALQRRAEAPFRAVAMDHVGFGLSDTADYELVCMDHADNLEELVGHLDLEDVTLVVHDWGGPTGVGAFLRHSERVSNLVLTNTTVFPLPFVGRTFDDYPMRYLPWSRFPLAVPDRLWGSLAAYAVFRTPAGPARLVGGLVWHALRAETGHYPAHERRARRVYHDQFRDRGNVRASKRLVRQTRYWGHGNTFTDPRLGERNTRPFYEFLHENVGPLWGPTGQDIGVRAVVGRWDPTAKDEVLDQWREALPQLAGHVEAFEGRGHFIEEQEPGAVARAVGDVAGLE